MTMGTGYIASTAERSPSRHRSARQSWTLRIAQTREDVLALGPLLEDLKRRHGADNPQNDIERFLAVIDADGPGTSPYVAAWMRGDRAQAAIMARMSHRLVRPRFGYLRLPGLTLSCLDIVYGGLLVDDSPGLTRRVTHHLQSMLEARTVEHININRLPAWHAMRDPLRSLHCVADSPEPHWVIELGAGGFDATMACHSAKHRSNLRRLDRRLCDHFADHVELKAYTQASDVDAYLALAELISVQSYHGALGAGVQNNARWRQMLTVEAQRGRMLCFALVAGGKPIAYQAGVRYGETYFAEGTSYLPQFETLRPGTVMLVRSLQALCDQGARRIDLGFGDAEYKRIYGTHVHDEVSVRLFGSSSRAASAGWVDRCISAAEQVGRRAVERSGKGESLRQGWRRMLRQPRR